MTSPRLLQIAPEMREQSAEIRAELLAGLTAPSASIAPKYLYDALGSRLFAAITELPEYYPTRTEAAIFAEYQDSMAAVLAPVATLVDLGAGNCAKAAICLRRDATRRSTGPAVSGALPRPGACTPRTRTNGAATIWPCCSKLRAFHRRATGATRAAGLRSSPPLPDRLLRPTMQAVGLGSTGACWLRRLD